MCEKSTGIMKEAVAGRVGGRAAHAVARGRRLAVRACERLAVRACGRLAVRACGRLAVRACERLAVRACGRLAVRACERVVHGRRRDRFRPSGLLRIARLGYPPTTRSGPGGRTGPCPLPEFRWAEMTVA
jgi:hypothetical protein